MHRALAFPIAMVIAVSISCDSGGVSPESKDGSAVEAGGVVDSILSTEEALLRFRVGLPVVTKLATPATSRDSLVSLFLSALERNDTAALRALVVDRAEYAYLYFPSSVYASKPYELSPEIAWSLNQQNGDKGLSRVIGRLGGRQLASPRYSCGDSTVEAVNIFWRVCTLSFVDPATSARVDKRVFGAVMQRDSRFKFLSYSNDF